jgi:glycylpeptide N-tetradecanoyltransferase
MVNPKEAGDAAEVEALGEAVTKKANVKDEESGHSSEGEGEGEPAGAPTGEATAGAKAKKKKSKKSKVKKALGLGGGGGDPGGSNPASKLTPGMVEQLLEMNPSLKGEVAGMNKEKAAEVLKKLEVGDLLTGMVGTIV